MSYELCAMSCISFWNEFVAIAKYAGFALLHDLPEFDGHPLPYRKFLKIAVHDLARQLDSVIELNDRHGVGRLINKLMRRDTDNCIGHDLSAIGELNGLEFP